MADRLKLLYWTSSQVLCHCLSCQKISGGTNTANIPVAREKLTVISGAPKSHTQKHEDGFNLAVFFCGDCGTVIYKQADADMFASISLIQSGTLDGSAKDKISQPISELNVKLRAPWRQKSVPLFKSKDLYDIFVRKRHPSCNDQIIMIYRFCCSTIQFSRAKCLLIPWKCNYWIQWSFSIILQMSLGSSKVPRTTGQPQPYPVIDLLFSGNSYIAQHANCNEYVQLLFHFIVCDYFRIEQAVKLRQCKWLILDCLWKNRILEGFA